MPVNACYNCTKREIGCHSTCEDYKNYQNQRIARNRHLRELKTSKTYTQVDAITAKRKMGESMLLKCHKK